MTAGWANLILYRFGAKTDAQRLQLLIRNERYPYRLIDQGDAVASLQDGAQPLLQVGPRHGMAQAQMRPVEKLRCRRWVRITLKSSGLSNRADRD